MRTQREQNVKNGPRKAVLLDALIIMALGFIARLFAINHAHAEALESSYWSERDESFAEIMSVFW